MKELKTNFLVVTKKHFPLYILRDVDIIFLNLKDRIAKIANEGKIDQAIIVESGSPWSSAIPRLRENTLLVVADTKTSPPQLRGVINSYEISSRTQQFRQYRSYNQYKRW